MGYSFTDLGAEGCRRSLNALFVIHFVFYFPLDTRVGDCADACSDRIGTTTLSRGHPGVVCLGQVCDRDKTYMDQGSC